MLRLTTILLFGARLAVANAWAGGSGLNVIVVVNQHSPNSVQLGNDYCEARGVPPQNLLRLTNWTGSSVNWSPTDFTNILLNPLLGMIQTRGLTNQAQFVLLSMDIPYRVVNGTDANSTTAALYYGFKTNGPPIAGFPSCSLPDNTSNSYAYSELPFSQAQPNTAATNSFLAMMLTDVTLARAENTLLRAVASDSTFPTQAVYLAKTTDEARSLRFVEFDNAIFENQVAGNFSLQRINSNSMNFTNLFGLQAGLDIYSLNANTFVPGSLGDTLTSFGGYILDPTAQTTALAYLDAGAAGSYGTIVEPCAYTQKFPDPIDYFYQTRGFSLAEAYYQSVLNPFQGLFVGEPLAAPFARPGTGSWTSPTNGSVLSGTALLTPTFTAADTNRPLSRVDLFVDGTFFQTMTNILPALGSALSVNLNGNVINYTVAATNGLSSVAAGVAGALDAQSGTTHINAFSAGDRIELQSLDVYVPGSNVTASANPADGLNVARPMFLDTVATGFQVVDFYRVPQIGDWIAVTFTKTNGTLVTLSVTNTVAGTTIGTLARNIFNLILTAPALQSADGATVADFQDDESLPQAEFFLYAKTPGWPAAQTLAAWSSSTNLIITPAGGGPLADNVNDLRPRNHIAVTCGTNFLAVNFPLDTTQLADGHHQLTAVAYEGSSVATQTRVTRDVVVQNSSLTATFGASPTGTNATLAQTLHFSVVAGGPAIARIELFGSGGSLGTVSSQSTAGFDLPAGFLGLGLHPFYALVTDAAGHRYQTQTVWYRIIPPIPLTFTGASILSWPTIPGRQYDLQFTTNLAAAFQTLTTITATGSTSQWSVTATNRAAFYRVKLDQ